MCRKNQSLNHSDVCWPGLEILNSSLHMHWLSGILQDFMHEAKWKPKISQEKEKEVKEKERKEKNFYHIIELSFLEPKSVEHLVKVHNICKLSLFSNTPLLAHSLLHYHSPFLCHRLHIGVSKSKPSRKIIVSAYHQAMVIVLKTGLLQTSLWRMEHRRW